MRPSTTEHGYSLRVEESPSTRSGTAKGSFDIGSFELVRRFVEHMVSENASARLGNAQTARLTIDWADMEASVADSSTLEEAIGRAVVIADKMSRGIRNCALLEDSPSSLKIDEPFFAFSMADVVPDFGDGSRYRTRVARRATSIFGIRRTAVI